MFTALLVITVAIQSYKFISAAEKERLGELFLELIRFVCLIELIVKLSG